MERRVGDAVVPDAPKPEHEISAILAVLSTCKPDILGVTEIGTAEDLEDFRLRMDRAGNPLPHTTLVLAADPERHIALLSKFPIGTTRHQTHLTYRLGASRLAMQRGILDAEILVRDGYTLRVLGVHLKSRRPVEEADQALMRRHEAHLLRRHVLEILKAEPGVNLLLFGDFNDTREQPSIREIQGRAGTEGHLKAIRAADAFGLRWTYYWEEADVYSRFDYLFVSSGLAPEVLWERAYIPDHPDWMTGSDHRPLVALIYPENR
ncbi:MAG TPA: endonuclease/exonuclease/phosphatase family protein [Verrucomicrobiales bacterium]|nr:endonuclease/exonuclease/phosphatase family protein [Verrucomicrobiales bacterium]